MKLNFLSIPALVAGLSLFSCDGGQTPETPETPDNPTEEPSDPDPEPEPEPVPAKPVVLWIDAEANFSRLRTQANIKRYLDLAEEAGFNAIVVDVKPVQGDVLYDSDLFPHCTTLGGVTLANRGFDYLQFFIDQARERGMRISVSTTIMTLGQPRTQSGPGYTDPYWDDKFCVEYLPTGLQDIRDTDDYGNVFAFLNPVLPEVHDYVMRLVNEIATKYDFDGYVPGINNILLGGYALPDSTKALSVVEKMKNGKKAIAALSDYREAKQEGDQVAMEAARQVIDENMKYFGYGYIDDPNDLVPNVWLSFWAFRVMVGLGMYFIAFFALILFLAWKRKLSKVNWLHYVALASIPLAYLAGQAGWIVAEVGRQPWTIQDLLPVNAAISRLETGSVQTTFFIFLILFTVLLIAEIGIMLKAIQKGPEEA